MIPYDEIHIDFVRASGPGGQNVNKTATKAQLRWRVGTSRVFSPQEKERIRARLQNRINNNDEIVLSSSAERSQGQNKETVVVRLQQLVRRNKTRIDYLEKFQMLIEDYNTGAHSLEVIFDKLVEFTQELNEEEQRGIKEQLSEEELALFDLLTKPDMKLTKKEAKGVKKVARELLETLKREKLVLDWRKRQQTRAAVKVAIADMLDRLPETYSKEKYEEKCGIVFQHIYDSYYGEGRSVYAKVG